MWLLHRSIFVELNKTGFIIFWFIYELQRIYQFSAHLRIKRKRTLKTETLQLEPWTSKELTLKSRSHPFYQNARSQSDIAHACGGIALTPQLRRRGITSPIRDVVFPASLDDKREVSFTNLAASLVILWTLLSAHIYIYIRCVCLAVASDWCWFVMRAQYCWLADS